MTTSREESTATATVATAGLRERKKRKTRSRIEAVSMELFLSKGFDETTVEEIAAIADLSTRTFFRYFPTKEAVVFTNERAAIAKLRSSIRSQPEGTPPLEALRQSFVMFGHNVEMNRAAERARDQLVYSHPSLRARVLQIQETWESELAAELSDRHGSTYDQATTTLCAATGVAAYRVAFDLWRQEEYSDLPSLIERMFDQLATIIAGSGGAAGTRT